MVPGKLLADISKSLPSEKAYMQTNGSTLQITSGKSTFTLQLMPETEYPDLFTPERIGLVGRALSTLVVHATASANEAELTSTFMLLPALVTGGAV